MTVFLRQKNKGGIVMPLFSAVCLFLMQPAAWAQQAAGASHLQAARNAIAAIHATDQFDDFLPDAALTLKNDLSRRDPNLSSMISKTVDSEAMGLVPRRADLEKEVARVYAKYFSEKELKEIAAFYNSSAGKKLLREGGAAMTESIGAYEIWRQGVGQDLGVGVSKALNAQLEKEAVDLPQENSAAAQMPAAKTAKNAR